MTDATTESDLRQRVLDLIQQDWDAHRGGPLPEISDTSNLFDLGVVDSLLIMEIVTLFEDETGRMIDFLTVDPESFFTLKGIVALYDETAPRGAS